MLHNTTLSPTLNLDILADQTDGFSGSDLQELCRNAAMVPLKEYMRSPEGLTVDVPEGFTLRPLTLRDFVDHDGDMLPPPGTQDPMPKGDPWGDPE